MSKPWSEEAEVRYYEVQLEAAISRLRTVVRDTREGSATCRGAFEALVNAKTALVMLRIEGIKAIDPHADASHPPRPREDKGN